MTVKFILGAILNYAFNNIITHIPIHKVRILFLRLINKKIHSSAVILLHTRILNFWKIEIKERVVINQYCLLDCRMYKITIGNDTDIGPYTKIWTLGHDPDSSEHKLYGGDVWIGHHVWIASSATILPAISIENGAVIAACSLVTKNIETLHIVGGVPASFIRKRNNALSYELSYTPFLD